MFNFSFKSLAEAAINTFTAPIETDKDLDNKLNEAKEHASSFVYEMIKRYTIEKSILLLKNWKSKYMQ